MCRVLICALRYADIQEKFDPITRKVSNHMDILRLEGIAMSRNIVHDLHWNCVSLVYLQKPSCLSEQECVLMNIYEMRENYYVSEQSGT